MDYLDTLSLQPQTFANLILFALHTKKLLFLTVTPTDFCSHLWLSIEHIKLSPINNSSNSQAKPKKRRPMQDAILAYKGSWVLVFVQECIAKENRKLRESLVGYKGESLG